MSPEEIRKRNREKQRRHRLKPGVKEKEQRYMREKRKDPKYKKKEQRYSQDYIHRPEIKARRSENHKRWRGKNKEFSAAYMRKYNKENPEARTRSKIQLLIWDYKRSHPCVDCGETDPVVLHFDHRDRSLKISEVSKMKGTASIELVFAEIEKCDVRCANCHARKTYYCRDYGPRKKP